MITFKSISSSSKGNAYLVESTGAPPLLLEAGLPFRKLRERLGFRLSGLAGCLVSHEHMDHAQGVKDLLKAGVECFMSNGTSGSLGVSLHHRTNMVMAGVPRRIGEWDILPFSLDHDATEPLGFFISFEADSLLFVPDTAGVKERFLGATIVAIECNHIGDVLDENVRSGRVDSALADRIRKSHLSLESLVAMLKTMDLSRCRQIYLLHLSDNNSDEYRMKKEVQQVCGIPVEVC